MAFDVQKALADGHSPAEIADYLGKQVGFDAAKARADGHADADILNHVMQRQSEIADVHRRRLSSAESGLSAEQRKAAPMSASDKALVGADLALAGASGAVVGSTAGGLAGLGARMSGHDPAAAKQWVDENLVYHPQSAEGQAIAGDIGQAAGDTLAPVGRAVSAADAAVGKYAGKGTQRVLRQTLGTVMDAASALPAVGLAAKGTSLIRAAAAAEAAKLAQTPAEIARASGHIMLPSTLRMGTDLGDRSSRLATVAESHAGTVKLDRAVVRRDLTNSNDLAAQAIGLAPKTTITDAAVAAAKAAPDAGGVYNDMRRYVPPARLDEGVQAAILGAGEGPASKLELPSSVQALKTRLAKGNVTWTTDETLNTMSRLRNDATKDMMSNDSDIVARGRAQLDIARALERHLETQLNGNRYIVTPEQFRGAREKFAKIFTVDNARGNSKAGIGIHDVDPQAIASFGRETRLAHGKSANTGELAIIENNASASPNESVGAVPKLQGGANNPLSAAWQTAAEVVRAPVRSVLLRTRGEMGGKTLIPGVTRPYMAARDNPQLANFFEKDRPARRPELELTQPPWPAFRPHQPLLAELGDMSSPMAESTQNPRMSLTLRPPPEVSNFFAPVQQQLDLSQDPDVIKAILDKLRKEAGQR